MSNIGKLFESEIRKFLECENLLVLRPVDIIGQRFTIKKKLDYACLDPSGYFVGVEAKSTRGKRFDFARIKEHQRESLSRIASTEYGKAFLALNFRDERAPGQAYLIPWGWWLDFEELLWEKKSIRRGEAIEQFEKFALRRVTGGWAKQGPRLI